MRKLYLPKWLFSNEPPQRALGAPPFGALNPGDDEVWAISSTPADHKKPKKTLLLSQNGAAHHSVGEMFILVNYLCILDFDVRLMGSEQKARSPNVENLSNRGLKTLLSLAELEESDALLTQTANELNKPRDQILYLTAERTTELLACHRMQSSSAIYCEYPQATDNTDAPSNENPALPLLRALLTQDKTKLPEIAATILKNEEIAAEFFQFIKTWELKITTSPMMQQLFSILFEAENWSQLDIEIKCDIACYYAPAALAFLNETDDGEYIDTVLKASPEAAEAFFDECIKNNFESRHASWFCSVQSSANASHALFLLPEENINQLKERDGVNIAQNFALLAVVEMRRLAKSFQENGLEAIKGLNEIGDDTCSLVYREIYFFQPEIKKEIAEISWLQMNDIFISTHFFKAASEDNEFNWAPVSSYLEEEIKKGNLPNEILFQFIQFCPHDTVALVATGIKFNLTEADNLIACYSQGDLNKEKRLLRKFLELTEMEPTSKFPMRKIIALLLDNAYTLCAQKLLQTAKEYAFLAGFILRNPTLRYHLQQNEIDQIVRWYPQLIALQTPPTRDLCAVALPKIKPQHIVFKNIKLDEFSAYIKKININKNTEVITLKLDDTNIEDVFEKYKKIITDLSLLYPKISVIEIASTRLNIEALYTEIKKIVENDVVILPFIGPQLNTSVPANQPKPLAKKLYIQAPGSDLRNMDSGNEPKTKHYAMISAGEQLAGTFTPRIRTSLLQYTYDGKNLSQAAVPPTRLVPVSAHVLTESELLTKQKAGTASVIQFKQRLERNKLIRLLSIHPQEEICVSSISSNIHIFRGEDNFYYALSDADQEFTYQTLAHKNLFSSYSYDSIPLSDPVKKIIETYLNDPKFSRIADPTKPCPILVPNSDYDTWIEALFEQRAGVCWHRSLAVAEKIKRGGYSNRVRIVSIDNTHEALEILYEGKWIPVDLGGGNNSKKTYTEATFLDQPARPVAPPASAQSQATIVPRPPNETLPHQPPRPRRESGVTTQINLVPQAAVNHARLEKLKNDLLKRKKPASGTTEDAYTTTVKNNRVLIYTTQKEKFSNQLISLCKKQNRPIFYIDAACLLSANKLHLHCQLTGETFFTRKTALQNFLAVAISENTEEQPILMIDFSNMQLTPQQRIALNTCFDQENRTILGIPIPSHVCVIALSEKPINDPALLSRFQATLDIIPSQEKIATSQSTETIDLCGLSDWKKALFGRIVLEDNKPVWQQSDFTKRLLCAADDSPICLILTHFPENKRAEIVSTIARAKARGYFEYYDVYIPLPDEVDIRCDENQYDFSIYEIENVVTAFSLEHFSTEQYLINTNTFDLLLHDKLVDNGTQFYREIPGLLAKHQNQCLSLVMTSNLSNSQWWCLFETAKKHHVTLQLCLTKDVSLPAFVKIKKPEKGGAAQLPTADSASAQASTVVNVEDHTFQDLFYHINYQKTENGFSQFSCQMSELLQKLIQGETIILKGEISPELLAYTETLRLPHHPHIWMNGRKQYISGKLIIDKTVDQHIRSAQVIYTEPTCQRETEFTTENAAIFINKRKTALLDALKSNNLLQLVGHSGVGKSRLMTELEGFATVYREYDNFENWARDSNQKTKILFIDESNIDNRHYTIFSPLKPGGNRQLFYRGKFYQLDEHHKVVFARNPKSYGGGRVSQRLFNDGTIPEIQLNDFSESYIYIRILKPIFDFAKRFANELSNWEEAALNFSKEMILYYHNRNADADVRRHMTVRELQHEALLYCGKVFSESGRYRFFQPAAATSSSFVITPSNRSAIHQCNAFLTVKSLQRQNKLPAQGIGINALLIEGEPSVGKSAMVMHLLEQQGYSKDQRADKRYIKIDASLPLDQKKILLLEAFRGGHVAWIDEIDTCIDDGLEKCLNQLLTGMDPETGNPLANPGFAIFTRNGVAHHDRSALSPALQHRIRCVELQQPTANDVYEILLARYPTIDKQTLRELSADFAQLSRESAEITLRGLLDYCDTELLPLQQTATSAPRPTTARAA
ncbi:MAG: hypothetical protein A3E84_00065 [Gammaproteobacteria bacterium RIFCSPHIGHO2_12_FULL_42_13]|nr:MAG: hypothetical protein A3E84_00065 [Gammaproteobacteria bacterium RIFCSPHIGHO2_12_FULL_42_13]